MNDATKETSNELEQDIEISNCKKGKTILNDFQCVPEVNDSTKNGVDKTQPESFNSCKTDEESKDIESGRNVVSTENDSSAKTSANGVEIETSSSTVDLNSTVDSFIRNNQESLDVKKQITASQKGDKNLSNLLTTLSINDDDNPEKKIVFVPYWNEEQLPDLVALITQDLSEPYSVYTYRYFLHNWPHLSDLAYCGSECVGAIVCKLDVHRKSVLRGYIAMLVVHKSYRRCKIGSSLVRRAILKMIDHGCEEVVLETEVTNKAALELYENLGFVRDKRLLRYYLNGVDAWRLKLWLK